MKRFLWVLLFSNLVLAASTFYLWWKGRLTVAAQSEKISSLEASLEKERAGAKVRALNQEAASSFTEPKIPRPAKINWEAQRQILKSPEMRVVKKNEAHEWVAKRYAGFFRRLRLTHEAETRLTDLLAEKRIIPFEVGVARQESGDGVRLRPAEMARLIDDASRPIDAEILALLGDSGFDYYKSYTRNAGARASVDEWMASSNAGKRYLSDEQCDIVAAALADSALGAAKAGVNLAAETSGATRTRFLEALAKAAVSAGMSESQQQLLAAAINKECDTMKDREELRAKSAILHSKSGS